MKLKSIDETKAGWKSALKRAICSALGLAATSGAAVAAPLPKVVSINTCTDQLVLALAQPEQILGLSRFARNPEMSFLAPQAARYPRLRGAAEEALRLRPDVVLAGQFSGRATREALTTHNVRVETFAPPRTIDEARSEIGRVAAILQQVERGAQLVAAIDAAVAGVMQAAADRPSYGVLAIQRRTFVSGRATLISDVLARAKLVNLAGRLDIDSIGQVSLEALLRIAPDALVIEGLEGTPDQSTAVLHHPVLAQAFPQRRRIVLPVAEVTCGGPALPSLITRVGTAAARLQAQR